MQESTLGPRSTWDRPWRSAWDRPELVGPAAGLGGAPPAAARGPWGLCPEWWACLLLTAPSAPRALRLIPGPRPRGWVCFYSCSGRRWFQFRGVPGSREPSAIQSMYAAAPCARCPAWRGGRVVRANHRSRAPAVDRQEGVGVREALANPRGPSGQSLVMGSGLALTFRRALQPEGARGSETRRLGVVASWAGTGEPSGAASPS